jgi:hypothetical protein
MIVRTCYYLTPGTPPHQWLYKDFDLLDQYSAEYEDILTNQGQPAIGDWIRTAIQQGWMTERV